MKESSLSAPITPLTPDQRFNFVSCTVDAAGWPLGIAFFSTSTIVPLYLNHLHASNLLIGLLPALVSIGYNIPGLLVAGAISRLSQVRTWLIVVAILERLPLILVPGLIFLVRDPNSLVIGFFALYVFHSLMTGLNQPAYWVAVGKTVPTQWRGRMFGYAGVAGGLLGFIVLPVTSYLLGDRDGGYPNGFAWCFLIGSVVMFISVAPLGFLREPKAGVMDRNDQVPLLPMAKQIWRTNAGFRRFIRSQMAFSIWSLATPFYLLDGIHRFHISGGQVALFTAVGAIVQAFGGLLWGSWSDRRGNKAVLLVSAGVAAFASIFALAAPTSTSLVFVFAAAQLALGGVQLAGYNIVMEFAPDERQISQYTAVYNGFTAPVRAAAVVIGGVVADHFSYPPVFIVSIIAAVVCFALTWSVIEPRHFNQNRQLEPTVA